MEKKIIKVIFDIKVYIKQIKKDNKINKKLKDNSKQSS